MSLLLFGPQRPVANVRDALRSVEGRVLVISAAWRGDETDLGQLRELLGADVEVLPLYGWFEMVMREVPELRAEYRARQDALLAMRRLHRLRLHPAIEVVRALIAEADDADTPVLRETLELAHEDVRRIDSQLVAAAARIHAAHAGASAPWTAHPVVLRLRDRAAEAIADAGSVVVTGGHLAILLNRLQFFGVDVPLRAHVEAGRSLLAWSAGAMVLCARVALFYDDPPEGPAHPELLDAGLDLVGDLVVFPHARQRLRLDDPVRVGMVASRFGPAACVGLESGAWLSRGPDGRWTNRGPPGSAFQLLPSGEVLDLPETP